MSEPGPKRNLESLVDSLLARAAAVPQRGPAKETTADPHAADAASAATGGASPAPASPADLEREARELIEVYFELDSPAERDVVIDRLIELELPGVTEFLRVMMIEDADEIVRATAASELARRGVPEAFAVLEADLVDPEEPFLFENALDALAAVRGPAFYDTVKEIWLDGARDADQRRAAMLEMENIDPARAMADFETFIAAQTDPAALPDDEIEAAMLAFARQGYTQARPALEALRDRIHRAALDPDERRELEELVQEGLDLLVER